MLAFAISLLAKGFRYTMLLINSVVYRKPLTSKDAFGMAYIASAFNAQFVDCFLVVTTSIPVYLISS